MNASGMGRGGGGVAGRLVAFLTILAMVGAACTGTTNEVASVDELEPHPLVETDEGDEHEEATGDYLEVTLEVVEGERWIFSPSYLEIPVGQRVRLVLVNHGRAEHDVEIPGLPVEYLEAAGGEHHERLAEGGDENHIGSVVAAHALPGTTTAVLFTPTLPGSYEFSCTLPGHKQAGMVGRLVVTR